MLHPLLPLFLLLPLPLLCPPLPAPHLLGRTSTLVPPLPHNQHPSHLACLLPFLAPMQVGPRMSFSTAWCANALSICSSCGLDKVSWRGWVMGFWGGPVGLYTQTYLPAAVAAATLQLAKLHNLQMSAESHSHCNRPYHFRLLFPAALPPAGGPHRGVSPPARLVLLTSASLLSSHPQVDRIEVSRRFLLRGSAPLTAEEKEHFASLVHDRMTEQVRWRNEWRLCHE